MTLSWSDTINAAELMASSPERVYEWLRARYAATENDRFGIAWPPELENALLNRKEPLIELAIARYSRDFPVREALFQRLESLSQDATQEQKLHAKALRLACLSSRGGASTSGSNERLVALITSGEADEIEALITNPRAGDGFLADFVERKEPWDVIPSERWLLSMSFLFRNPRVAADYKENRFDGFDEYLFGRLAENIWKLAETGPVQKDWAWMLSSLLGVTTAKAVALTDPLAVAKRWVVPDRDEELKKQEEHLYDQGMLGPFGSVRATLCRLAIAKGLVKSNDILLGSDDVALRCGGYSYLRTTAEEMATALEKEPKLFFEHAVRNENIWKAPELRETLREASWKVPDPSSYMDAQNTYLAMQESYAAKHPEWFEEKPEEAIEQDPGEAEQEITLAGLDKGIAELGRTIALVKVTAEATKWRTGLIWWVALGAVVVFLAKQL